MSSPSRFTKIVPEHAKSYFLPFLIGASSQTIKRMKEARLTRGSSPPPASEQWQFIVSFYFLQDIFGGVCTFLPWESS